MRLQDEGLRLQIMLSAMSFFEPQDATIRWRLKERHLADLRNSSPAISKSIIQWRRLLLR